MTAFLSFFVIIALIWAISDVISVKSKAVLSATFLGFGLMLISAWVGIIPADFMPQTQLTGMATLCIPLLLIHMGSVMNLDQMKSEWKTILITIGGLIALLAIMLPFGSLIIGKEYVLTGIPIIFGGGVAGLVLTSQLTASALPNAGVLIGFVWFLAAAQMFVGIPLSTFALKKFAKGKIESNSISQLEITTLANGKKSKCIIPEKYQTPAVLITIAALLGLLGSFIGGYTNKYLFLHENIIMLLIGFVAVLFGIIPENIMKKANSYGILNFILFIYLSSLVTQFVSVETFIMLLKPIVIMFSMSVPAICIGAVVMAKIIKLDPWLAVALMSSCLSGFPMTIVMSEEVSNAVGRNKEEQEILKGFLVPKMLIAGLFTVSCFSGVVASILGNFL